MHFDSAGKIIQIRQYWDQGSLLKQIDVIGSRSRNWPIRDGKDQSRLISTSSKAGSQSDSAPSTRPSTSRGADEVSIASRSRGSTRSTNATNDPHASLSLFQPRNTEQDESQDSRPIAPRAQSAKPPPREYSELFVGDDAGSPSPSPQKFPVKGGGGQNYKPSRLFDNTEDNEPAPTPTGVKTNAKKYNHFEFGDGEDTPTARDTARPSTRGKNGPNWDFEDFVTPNKPSSKTQPQNVRHFGWSDDEVSPIYQADRQTCCRLCALADMTLLQQEVSPIRRPIVHKARPDADPHFEFVDDGTPEAKRVPAATKGARGNKGQGLYEDHVTNTTNDADDGSVTGDVKRALNDLTTAIKNENRSKDFAPHWQMSDDSPAAATKNGTANQKPIPEARKAMTTNWDLYQNSPENRGINIAGNGMGGRKGGEAAFSLFNESPPKKENAPALGQGGIRTTGDGMGGRKNAENFWDF